MTLQELSAHFQAECYNPLVYHIGPGWESCGDTYCLERVGNLFEIFYVERGQRGKTIQCFAWESEACNAYVTLLDQKRFSRAHCVGSFKNRAYADLVAERLTAGGIVIHRDTVPYGGPSDLLCRVFGFGRDKLRINELLHKDA